jgi:hypothetical protein
MNKILTLLIVLISANCFGQLTFRDSIKWINGMNYKISYAVNESKTDTENYIYYNNNKEMLTETIIQVPPQSVSITGFKPATIVNKFQAKKNDDIIKELKKQKVKFDTSKIKSDNKTKSK